MNVEKCTYVYVCVLYGSPCAPLLLPWLGEVEGASLATTLAKGLPVVALIPMFWVPTGPVRAAVGGAADGRRRLRSIPAIRQRLGVVSTDFTVALSGAWR